MWGLTPYPDDLYKNKVQAPLDPIDHGDSHLRSVKEVLGYQIHSKDGDFGEAYDFLFDATSWSIRFLVVKTKKWFGGKKVLISPFAIENVNWGERQISVRMTEDQIKKCPNFVGPHLSEYQSFRDSRNKQHESHKNTSSTP